MNTRLRIFDDALYGWQVWLDAEVDDFSGLCIGAGATRDDALADAVRKLEEALCILQEPPHAERWIAPL